MEQFKTIEIPDNAVPMLKAGWELELKILEADIDKFKEKVNEFETRHGYTSEVFKEKFETGLLGDDEWCFDWINNLEILSELNNKFDVAKKVCI